MGKHEGNRPVWRPRRRREDNIKMDLEEVGCGSMDWIDLAQNRDSCECDNEPSGSLTRGEFLDWPRIGKVHKKDSTPWNEQVSK